jgi:DNA-binding response OmpR family regulator
VKILLIEDDPALASGVTEGLRHAGFEVLAVGTGAEGLELATSSTPPDLVLLDLGLPDRDGYDICREIRATSQVPIIVISARDDEIDRVVGLELGADDYVSKPFGVRELVARIRAVTRRTGVEAAPDKLENQVIGLLTIDRRAQRIFVGDVEVHLTATEFELLSVLAEDPGAVLRRTELLERIWDTALYVTPKTVDAHIAAVRKKLGHPEWIESKRGVGFRLDIPR